MKTEMRNNSANQKEVFEEKISEIQPTIANLKNSLKRSYAQRIKFIEKESEQLNEWLSEVSAQDKARIKAEITQLGELAAKLNENVVALTANTDDLFNRR